MATSSFESTQQSNEPGVATNIDFALRRVSITTALDPTYSPKLTAAVLAGLYASAITASKFEGHVIGQFIPLFLATLLVSVPVFLYNGGTIMRRGNGEQSKWIVQCLMADPLLEAFLTFRALPIHSFAMISVVGELSKYVGSLFALAIGATIIVAFRAYKAYAAAKRS